MISPVIAQLLPELMQLRQELHRHPELSGREYSTAERLGAYLQKYEPANLLTGLGQGAGLAAIFKGIEPGPTLMFRADMDALPIAEKHHYDYASTQPGVSHKCGHDGHMTMVAGLAPLLHKQPLKKGKVILLMQPAEETGQGAKALLEDPQFSALAPDYIFGLHNLPGYPLGQLVLRTGTFCAASKGLRVQLQGSTSHAAEPELGISPAGALAHLLQILIKLPLQLPCTDQVWLTITHAQLGEATFGTSPGEAVLQITLRANLEEDMALLSRKVEEQLHAIADKESLQLQLSYHEVFPVTQNSQEVSALLQRAAEKTGFSVHHKEAPFRWSEDFGYYQQLAPSGFFGLGAGHEQPNLHNPAYNFPDELLPYGLQIYRDLIAVLTD